MSLDAHERHTTCPRVRFVACVIVVICVGTVPAARAQELFPGFDFHFDSRYVSSGDPRFTWLFDLGGRIDAVRSDRVRVSFIGGYEAIAGEEFRRFDVNQGNYLLEGAVLVRVAGIEIGPVWHHISRHLSDRTKRFAIDWNMIAVRAQGDRRSGPLDVAWRADARATVTRAFVDYDWEVEARGEVAYRLGPRLGWTADTTVRVVGMDDAGGRGSQLDGRVETGIRLEGQGAAAQLFIGVERRLDPYPLELGTASWFLTGLRVSSR
ncbi:MAG: hypothetical protein ACRD26_02995 [Vicinamibacterales bacterium]